MGKTVISNSSGTCKTGRTLKIAQEILDELDAAPRRKNPVLPDVVIAILDKYADNRTGRAIITTIRRRWPDISESRIRDEIQKRTKAHI